jgi:hypothetical protein
MTDATTATMPHVDALDVELASHITGISERNERNHPAPNGRGKYSVQNEFGTVFENRNSLGKATIASPNKMPLAAISNISRPTYFSRLAIARLTRRFVAAERRRDGRRAADC